jgi:hypothetical protein
MKVLRRDRGLRWSGHSDHIGRVPHDLPFWRGVVMKLLITDGGRGGGLEAKVVWPKRRA